MSEIPADLLAALEASLTAAREARSTHPRTCMHYKSFGDWPCDCALSAEQEDDQ